jgi:uncharacterized protein
MPFDTILVGGGLALLVGLCLGLLGGGGSLLTVPILVYVLGLPPREAIATSLVIVGATSLVGALNHARQGRVRWRAGVGFGAAGLAGALIGGQLAGLFPPPVLLTTFAVMVVVTATVMLRPPKAPRAEPPPPISAGRRAWLVARSGLGVGVLTGLVGAGGGFMVVPALALVGGLGMMEAIGTSLLVISLNSAAGVVSQLTSGAAINWPLAGVMAAMAAVGSVVGSQLGGRLQAAWLLRAFGLFVLALGLSILGREIGLWAGISSRLAFALGGGVALLAALLAGWVLHLHRSTPAAAAGRH